MTFQFNIKKCLSFGNLLIQLKESSETVKHRFRKVTLLRQLQR